MTFNDHTKARKLYFQGGAEARGADSTTADRRRARIYTTPLVRARAARLARTRPTHILHLPKPCSTTVRNNSQ